MHSYIAQSSLGRYAMRQANAPKDLTEEPIKGYSESTLKVPLLPLQRHRMGFVSEKLIKQKRVATESEKLQQAVEDSGHTILNANSVFPFVLFPDTIHIDRQKLTIIHRSSFRSAKTISVPLDDLLNVEGRVGPLFGSLILTSKFFQNNVQSIDFLWRKDVIKAQLLLQGYVIAHHEKINLSNIPTEELMTMLNQLGQGSKNS